MSNGQKFLAILLNRGFTKMPWNKCPKGFKESNYQCFYHKEKNIWCEVYLTHNPQYGWIVGGGIKSTGNNGGEFFDDPKQLREILKSVNVE